MFDLLTEAHLNEIFNADSLGTVYPVEDLTPKAKVPQMLHMKVPGTNDLIIRLTHLDTVGTRVKAVQPGDKTVQVFLMSLSDKGNITDFRGGLGSDPVGAINTMFSTVMEISKKFHFESVLFRFTKTKMKGKSTQVTRVLSRLISQRSAGRFTTLEEVTRAESKKFDFVLAIKKNSNLVDSLVADAKGYQKVETKVGDAYIDTETGETVSKAEIAAEVLTSQSAKISDQQIASKSKISRRAAFDAMYGVGSTFAANRKVEAEKVFQDFKATSPVTKSAGTDSPVVKNVMNHVDYKQFGESLRTWDPKNPRYTQMRMDPDNLLVKFKDVFELTQSKGVKALAPHLEEMAKIVEDTNPLDPNSTIVKLANYFSTGEFASLSFNERQKLISGAIYTFVQYSTSEIRSAYMNTTIGDIAGEKYTPEEIEAIQDYTGSRYMEMNGFLLGRRDSIGLKGIGAIKTLDTVFETKGDTLPKGTTLYRGMELRIEQLKTVVETKILYFANVVSTSLIPVIYNGSFGDIKSVVDANSRDITSMNKIEDVIDTKMFYPDAGEVYADTGKASETSLGMVISGAHKINVIIPGSLSSNPSECEVILPRGTAMRVTKFMAPSDEVYVESTGLMYLDVIAPDQIDESMEFIDGDKFLSEGVVEKLSFSSLFDNQRPLRESLSPVNSDAENALLGCLNFSEVPARFMM